MAMEDNIRKRMCDISCISLNSFFPLVPSVITFAVLVSMSGYFFEEYGLLIMLQNFACVVLLTFENLVYFVIVGIDD